MNQEKATAVAADIFKHYPKADELFVTTDGQAFFTKNDAINHVKGNKAFEIFEVKRSGEVAANDVTDTTALAKQTVADLQAAKDKKAAALAKAKKPETIEKLTNELAAIDKELELAIAQVPEETEQ